MEQALFKKGARDEKLHFAENATGLFGVPAMLMDEFGSGDGHVALR